MSFLKICFGESGSPTPHILIDGKHVGKFSSVELGGAPQEDIPEKLLEFIRLVDED